MTQPSESNVISLPSAAVLKLQSGLNHDYVTGMKVTIFITIVNDIPIPSVIVPIIIIIIVINIVAIGA